MSVIRHKLNFKIDRNSQCTECVIDTYFSKNNMLFYSLYFEKEKKVNGTAVLEKVDINTLRRWFDTAISVVNRNELSASYINLDEYDDMNPIICISQAHIQEFANCCADHHMPFMKNLATILRDMLSADEMLTPMHFSSDTSPALFSPVGKGNSDQFGQSKAVDSPFAFSKSS